MADIISHKNCHVFLRILKKHMSVPQWCPIFRRDYQIDRWTHAKLISTFPFMNYVLMQEEECCFTSC